MLSKPGLLIKPGYPTRETMTYYRRNDGCFGILVFLQICGLIGYAIHQLFGWWGIGLATVAIVGIFVVIVLYSKYEKSREEEKRAKAPCKHGVIGALYESKACLKCQQEKAAAEQIAIHEAKEEEAQRKEEKERAYREWIEKIRLPEYLKKMDPREFERLVCELFRKMGFEVEHTSYSGDSGIDGYLRKDGNLSILQCKRVKGSVGEPVLRDLFGTMHATGAKEGVVVTTGNVSTKARNWAKDKPIRILELKELVENIRRFYREDDVVPENFVPHKRKGSS